MAGLTQHVKCFNDCYDTYDMIHTYDPIQASHTSGDPLRQYALFQYEHVIICNRNRI